MKSNHNCRKSQDLISDLVLNEQKVEENPVLISELERCSACREYYTQMMVSLKDWKQPLIWDDDNQFALEVMARIHRPVLHTLRMYPLRSFAAAAAILFGIGVGWLSNSSMDGQLHHDDFHATKALELFNDDLFATDIFYEIPQR